MKIFLFIYMKKFTLTNAAWSIMAPLLVVSVLQLSAIWFARTLEQLLNPRLAGKQK